MKRNLYLIIILVLVAGSCKKKDNSPQKNSGQATTLFKGTASLHTGADTTPYAELATVRQVSGNDSDYATLSNDALIINAPKHTTNSLRLFDTRVTDAVAGNPASFSMNVPPAGDQNPYNSCVAYAVGYGMLSYDYHTIENWTDYSNADHLFAANYIYNQLNGGKDTGITSIKLALDLVKEQGCSTLRFMPDLLDVLSQPNQQAIDNAADYTIEDYQVFPTADIGRIKTFLAKGYPLPFAAKIDTDFEAISLASFQVLPDKRLLYIKSTGKKKKLHAMLLVGYDDSINAFKVMNSWGNNWGNDGFFWLDYNTFKSILAYSFILPNLYLVIPKSVFTKQASAIGTTSAQCGGNVVVSEDGEVTDRGVCYATSTKPTINSAVKKGGAGKGKFSVTLDNLQPATTYYARAYSTTTSGTKYGNQVSFQTAANIDSSAYFTNEIVGKWKYVKHTANTNDRLVTNVADMTYKADGTMTGTDFDGTAFAATWSISAKTLTLVDKSDATNVLTWPIIKIDATDFVFIDPDATDSNGNSLSITFYFTRTQ